MGHNHNHSHNHSEGNVKVAFFLNLSFTIIEIIGGLYTNSLAILSDALHDLGDSLSLGLSWYFQKLSKKGRTKRFSYGYKRFSLLGAIINSIVLVAGSIFILTKAIPELFNPEETNALPSNPGNRSERCCCTKTPKRRIPEWKNSITPLIGRCFGMGSCIHRQHHYDVRRCTFY